MFDVLRFTYRWNYQNKWTCDDGFVEDPNGNTAQIDYYLNTTTNSFTMDQGQDCVVDNDQSSVELDNLGYAKFKVHFIRQLTTRGEINDAVLKTGSKINIDYFYKLTGTGIEDTKSKSEPVSLSILTGAGRLLISAVPSALLAL